VGSPAATAVLVVGATGFIGRYASAHLAENGSRVVTSSRSGRHTDLACDLLDPASVETVLERALPDAILVTAGNSSVGSAWEDPGASFETNTTGSFNLLEAVRRKAPAARVTLVSSATVYGPPASAAELPFTEGSPVRPASPYGASKAAAETLAGQYRRGFGIDVSIARIFNQIGPGQSEAQAPAEFARAIAEAEGKGQRKFDLEIGHPEAERDFTDVRDTARALAAIVTGSESGTFNICSGAGVRLYDIAAGLSAHTPLEIGVTKTPERAHPADVPLVVGSAARLKEATGWQPEIPLWISLLDLLDDWRRRI